MQQEYVELARQAQKVSENAYTPYSHFNVGCAVLTQTGEVFLGANIENASYGLSNCAERSALFNAFSNAKNPNIKALAVWTKQGNVFPCGACRQVILELAPKADIIINDKNGNLNIYKISELLPHCFDQSDLNK
ncbi:MAG: cytidine deaminase [Elusimicrobiota bacterium]|nr:cytidine deaminase [Elusimicrobiota bacterium]